MVPERRCLPLPFPYRATQPMHPPNSQEPNRSAQDSQHQLMLTSSPGERPTRAGGQGSRNTGWGGSPGCTWVQSTRRPRLSLHRQGRRSIAPWCQGCTLGGADAAEMQLLFSGALSTWTVTACAERLRDRCGHPCGRSELLE